MQNITIANSILVPTNFIPNIITLPIQIAQPQQINVLNQIPQTTIQLQSQPQPQPIKVLQPLTKIQPKTVNQVQSTSQNVIQTQINLNCKTKIKSLLSDQPILIAPKNDPKMDLIRAYEITNKILEDKIAKEQEENNKKNNKNKIVESSSSKVIKYTRRKSFYEVGNRQKNRLKRQIKEFFSQSGEFLRHMGLCLSQVEINPIELDECDFKLKIKEPLDSSDNEPNVNNLLFYKDKHSISDVAYGELKTKCNLKIPSLNKLKQRRNDINSMFEIYDNEMGVYMRLKDKLEFRLKLFFDHKYGFNALSENESIDFKDNIIHIKLGADGTNIGRNLKLLNFTFTILNEGAKSKTASGNYTLGIFEIENENHETITNSFKEIIEEIKNLNELNVYDKNLKLVYYYASDWKMLANCLGILSANSKYPCIWCKCCKEDFYDLSTEWSITDPKLGSRSHEEQASIINYPNSGKKFLKYGYERQPIFKDIIPFSRYMIDMLHLFLRISDTLFNLLIKDCSLADKFEMDKISKFDVTLYKHLNSLQHFLNEKCNVKFQFMWIAETKKLTWRDLVGPEKARLFENLNLTEIIPDHEMFDSLTKIWNEFYDILQLVKMVKINSKDLKQRTSDWLRLYLTVYNKSTITPYMHAFVAHLHEFVYLYKDINAFNCQGLEKLNDISTGQYFKGTNRKDTALHQMLKKRNRMEYLSSYVTEED